MASSHDKTLILYLEENSSVGQLGKGFISTGYPPSFVAIGTAAIFGKSLFLLSPELSLRLLLESYD